MKIRGMIPVLVEKETTIDLSKDDLYGFQPYVYASKIARYIAAIRSGDEFPPVYVVEHDYRLSLAYWVKRPDAILDIADGGHHRSVAHLDARVPLRAAMITMPPTGNDFEFVQHATTHIGDIRRINNHE